MPSQKEKAIRFSAMHEQGCFLLPNAWDFASAALVIDADYEALATTSAGVAFAQGFVDGEAIGRERMLSVAGSFAERFDVPVTADLETGYGHTPDEVAGTVIAAIKAGLVGCNLEDGVPGAAALFDRELAVARISAAVAAAKAAGLPEFSINARTDPYLRMRASSAQRFDESVARANLYLDAGARSAFVPGVVDLATLRALAGAINGALNAMAVGGGNIPSLDEIASAGVRRVSLGGSWMSAAYGAARDALRTLRITGAFAYPSGVGYAEFMTMLSTKGAGGGQGPAVMDRKQR